MKSEIKGEPAFAFVEITLDIGESVTAESDAMSTMSVGLTMTTHFNGGFFRGLFRKMFGGETLFVNTFTNNTEFPKMITLVQPTPGAVREIDLENGGIFVQPGAFLCATPGIGYQTRWAGFASWFGGEGLFRNGIYGTGRVWIGAYGALIEREVEGELIVDGGHLVAYDPGVKLKVGLAGGIFSSLFGGEGFITRVSGTGKVMIQTRSIQGLASWLNSKIY